MVCKWKTREVGKDAFTLMTSGGNLYFRRQIIQNAPIDMYENVSLCFGSPPNACADLLPLVVLVVIPFVFSGKISAVAAEIYAIILSEHYGNLVLLCI